MNWDLSKSPSKTTAHSTQSELRVAGPRRTPRLRRAMSLGVAATTLMMVAFASAQSLPGFQSDQAEATETGLHFAAFGLPGANGTLTSDAAAALIDWHFDGQSGGAELKIGIIDGGVNTRHPALVDRNIRTRDFRVDKSLPIPMDHGTAVTALLVGNARSGAFKGLLPNATIYAGNIFSEDSGGRILGDPVAFYEAVEWMIDAGVSVINVSVTGQHDPIVARAINRALEAGVLVVAAAGNNRGVYGRDYPAAYDGVLAATAVDSRLNIYRYASLGDHIDFAAPGVSMRMASNRGSQVLSGTSFATPFLTAAVAVAARDQRGANADSIRRLLSTDSKDLGQRGVDNVYGRGLIVADRLGRAAGAGDNTVGAGRRSDAGPIAPRPIRRN